MEGGYGQLQYCSSGPQCHMSLSTSLSYELWLLRKSGHSFYSLVLRFSASMARRDAKLLLSRHFFCTDTTQGIARRRNFEAGGSELCPGLHNSRHILAIRLCLYVTAHSHLMYTYNSKWYESPAIYHLWKRNPSSVPRVNGWYTGVRLRRTCWKESRVLYGWLHV